MPIDPEKLLALDIPEVVHSYGPRDAMLYALGLGLGLDLADEGALSFVYERSLRVLPTLATTLANPVTWIRDYDTGINHTQLLHGEQSLRLHRVLPPEGRVIGRMRVTDIIDKGLGKGAILVTERQILEALDGKLVATSTKSIFCRADGGFGGENRSRPAPPPLPQRPPDHVCDLPTSVQSALVYRLSGDSHPLHADPEIARAAGFPRPILHGLATFGITGYAILKSCCNYDPARFAAISARFTAPVFPGETIRTEIWRDGLDVSYQARVVERDIVVLSHGRAEITE